MAALEARTAKRVAPSDAAGRAIGVDGFNVLMTVESALGGALVFRGRDGCYRDIAGVHGSYRKIAETLPALVAVGETLESIGAGPCTWLFDRPVSNSGRLAALVRDLARERAWPWTVDLVFNPDAVLRDGSDLVASADGAVIERAPGWINLARVVVDRRIHDAWIVGLYPDR